MAGIFVPSYTLLMVIKETTQIGNNLIRAKAKKVSSVRSKTAQKVVKDLVDSMRYHDLVGMAAPQIGKRLRIFVTEIRKTNLRKSVGTENLDPLRIFINPKAMSFSKDQKKDWEGCGSVASAGLFGMVSRPTSITIEALNEKGEKFQLKASNLLARVIQHEMNHLDGIVFTDNADTKTYMSRNEYLKFRKKGTRDKN